MFGRKKAYRKIARGGATLVARFSLWQGSDHLLLMAETNFVERYRRFFFSEIQSIVIRRTASWLIGTAILVLAAVLFSLPIWLAELDFEANLVWGIIAGCFLFFTLIHLIMGPSCRCRIQTAAGEADLPPITRVRQALRLLRRLRPFIDLAQPPMPTDTDVRHTYPPRPAPRLPRSMRVETHSGGGTGGVAHRIAIGMLLLSGIIEIVRIFAGSFALAVIEQGILALTFVAMVGGIIHQHRHAVVPALRRTMIGALVLYCVLAGAGSMHSMVLRLENLETARNPLAFLELLGSLTGMNSTFTLWANMILAIGSLFFAVAGLLALTRPQVPSGPPPLRAEPAGSAAPEPRAGTADPAG